MASTTVTKRRDDDSADEDDLDTNTSAAQSILKQRKKAHGSPVGSIITSQTLPGLMKIRIPEETKRGRK